MPGSTLTYPSASSASCSLKSSVLDALALREAGCGAREIQQELEASAYDSIAYAGVETMEHLRRGGRIGRITALAGTMLSIKPVLHVDDTGHLVPVRKTRGRKASLLALVDRMAESAVDPAGQTIFISHGDCEADAEFVADEVRRRFGVQDIYINYVGPVIGNHSGPGTLALFFLGSRR